MQLIGFNFTKIFAVKNMDFKTGRINAGVTFDDLETQKLDLLKDGEAIKVSFKHTLEYDSEEVNKKKKKEKDAELSFEGNLLLSISKEESKEIMKSWKKKEIPGQMRLFLTNLILKKCAARALALQEDLGLQSHIQIPRIAQKQQ